VSTYQHIEKDTGDVIEPDMYAAQVAVHSEFMFEANKVLSAFRKKWREDHKDDNYGQGLEMDLVPMTYDGDIYGFLVISEIDGESYDYAPVKRTRKADQK
jgi:hypothetical protein